MGQGCLPAALVPRRFVILYSNGHEVPKQSTFFCVGGERAAKTAARPPQ